MKAWNYLQKILELPLNTKIIRQARELMMEKDVLAGEYRKSPAFPGYHIFAPADYIERYMEATIFRFHGTKNDDPIMIQLCTNLFGNIINTYPFEDRNGRICRLILAHVLIKMKCCLFPFILSSYHRRGRGHYIRAIKMLDGKASILYTMIVKYLANCWHNFEPDARMTLNFKHLPTDQTRPGWVLKFNKDVFCDAICL